MISRRFKWVEGVCMDSSELRIVSRSSIMVKGRGLVFKGVLMGCGEFCGFK